MDLAKAGERRIIEAIKDTVRRNPAMIADFDDDAAIMELSTGKYAVTTDMGLMETHFLTKDPVKIGKKIVTSNVTDLLAKGAMPKYMLVSLGLPEGYTLGFIKKLYRSMDAEMAKYGAHIIGGDTNKSGGFVYSVTMFGPVLKPLLRAGAKAGDSVVLTGQVGSASAGYIALKNGLKADSGIIRAQLEPEIDLELCRKIIPGANAGIDISDGLAYELGEIARLSKKKITVYWDRIPVHEKLMEFCRRNRLSMEDIVFHYGEDYQIAYTAPKPKHGIVIGRVEEGKGLHLVKDGRERKLEPKGYEHFKSN
jgi:thiamine-monophosphate kinase